MAQKVTDEKTAPIHVTKVQQQLLTSLMSKSVVPISYAKAASDLLDKIDAAGTELAGDEPAA